MDIIFQALLITTIQFLAIGLMYKSFARDAEELNNSLKLNKRIRKYTK